MGKGFLKLRGSLADEHGEPAPTSTYASMMSSDSSILSSPSPTPSSYPSNTGVSRSGNSATSVSSLYDDRKQAHRSAVVQAFADPVVPELMEKAARACKVKRDNSGAYWYASQVMIAARIR
jgi:hypothetical protein